MKQNKNTKNCVKISYKGLTRQITCNANFQYDDLLKTVMDKFNIENSLKSAIEFYDEQGHKYNQDTFMYFLLLFPNPHKIFFIRLDSAKVFNLTSSEGSPLRIQDNERVPFGKSKANNKQTTKSDGETYCKAVPVRRQNCFLGEIPGSMSTQQQSSLSESSDTQLSTYLSLQIAKRMPGLKQSSPKKKHLNSPNLFKRSLRI